MLPKPCFGCDSKERDPGRTKTCAKGHYLCSVCHKDRRTCPFCEATLKREQLVPHTCWRGFLLPMFT